MIRLIRFLITGDWHLHEWVTEHSHKILDSDGEYAIGTAKVCRCSHCGKWKRFDLT